MSGGLFMLNARKRAQEGRRKGLREAFRRADKDGDGALSRAEWADVLKEAGMDLTSDEVETMFVAKDRDHDGKLSFEEFVGQETKLERAFKAMDKDGDGFITKSEFHKLCRNLTSDQVEVAFAKFDKVGDGKLNYREFCGLMNARKMKAASSSTAVDDVNPNPSRSPGKGRRRLTKAFSTTSAPSPSKNEQN